MPLTASVVFARHPEGGQQVSPGGKKVLSAYAWKIAHYFEWLTASRRASVAAQAG
jgi:hypothetical protein